MEIQDLSNIILKWFAFSPYARGNSIFTDIEKGIVRDNPRLPEDYDLTKKIEKCLENIEKDKYIISWMTQTNYFTKVGQIEPEIRTERKYAITFEGQIEANNLRPLNSEIDAHDVKGIDLAIPLINSYGSINWTNDITNVLFKEHQYKFKGSIESYFLRNGFSETKFIPVGSQHTPISCLTNEGRRLKALGSLGKYNEQISAEKIKENFRDNINDEILESQRILNPLMIKANESAIETNDNIRDTNENIKTTNVRLLKINYFLKNVFVWTLVISIGGFAIASITLGREIYKDSILEKLQKSEKKLQSKNIENNELRFQNNLYLHEWDSLRRVVDSLTNNPSK